MQLSKLFKGLAVALPVMALAACSSTTGTENTGSETDADQPVVVAPVESQAAPAVEEQIQTLSQQDTVFFAFDNAEIQPEYETMLAKHAAFLRDNPSVNVIVEGHADERGTPEYNIALGERRAKAVVAYLQSLGVSGAQLSIVSYGEEKPLVLGQDAEAYAKNRRGVLVY